MVRDKSKVSRVILVDEHPLVRMPLAALINAEPDFAVCGQACSRTEALAVARAKSPDLAVVGLNPSSSAEKVRMMIGSGLRFSRGGFRDYIGEDSRCGRQFQSQVREQLGQRFVGTRHHA